MKVIMLESTNNVGMVGEIVNVKPGFATQLSSSFE
jgi:ribosomal protein L9